MVSVTTGGETVVGGATVVVGLTVVGGATVVVGRTVVVVTRAGCLGAVVVVAGARVVAVVEGERVVGEAVARAGALVVGGDVTRTGSFVVDGAVTRGAVVPGPDVPGRVTRDVVDGVAASREVVDGVAASRDVAGPDRCEPPPVADLALTLGSAPATTPMAAPASPKSPGADDASSSAASGATLALDGVEELVRARPCVDVVGAACEVGPPAAWSSAPASTSVAPDAAAVVLDVDDEVPAVPSSSPSSEERAVVVVVSEVATLNGSGPGSSTSTANKSATVPTTMATFTCTRSYHGVMTVPPPAAARCNASDVRADRHPRLGPGDERPPLGPRYGRRP